MSSKPKAQKTTTRETELAKTQATILEEREGFAQEYFFPELLEDLQSNTVDNLSPRFQDLIIGAQQPELRQQNASALRSLQQRGVTGGVMGSGLASLQVANQSAQGQARLQGDQLARATRAQTLAQIASTVPSPTTAAPFVTETR